MCKFKSGIIFKNRVVVCEDENDSHSDLLELLDIRDSTENAMTLFVRAELYPENNEWWTSVDEWTFNVDQDICPSWFDADKEKYEIEFRNSVKMWVSEHVKVNKAIEKLSSGYYLLKDSEVEELSDYVKVQLNNSRVTFMCDYSIIINMDNNSNVKYMSNNSKIIMMSDSNVEFMNGYSTIIRVLNSTIFSMRDASNIYSALNSIITYMYDFSIIIEMWNNTCIIHMYENSIAKDYSNGKLHLEKGFNLEINQR